MWRIKRTKKKFLKNKFLKKMMNYRTMMLINARFVIDRKTRRLTTNSKKRIKFMTVPSKASKFLVRVTKNSFSRVRRLFPMASDSGIGS